MRGVTAFSTLGFKIKFIRLIKKKKNAKIVKAKEINIPIVQNIRQNLGAFFDIFRIRLFNFLVLNKAIKGKKTTRASFFFLNKYDKIPTIPQKTTESRNHGFKKISIIKSDKLI